MDLPLNNVFAKPVACLKRTNLQYPAWEKPDRSETQKNEYRLSAPDFKIPLQASLRSRNFRLYDEELQYRLVMNDGTRQSLMWLTMARNVFKRELTQMPENYITRLVFNEHHRTVLLLKNGVVMGGITFRPFAELDFAEIAFCAVSSLQQIQGFGAHVMAHVKTHLQAINIHNILTYADNTAVGYFKRQGFTLEIKFDPQIWRRCIKDYQGATLIHCKIRPDVDYLRVNDVVDQQKQLVSNLLPDLEVHSVNQWPVKEIQGIAIDKAPQIDVVNQMKLLVEKTKLHSRAWPFLKPVSKNDAANYAEIIKNPMDLSTLEKNVNDGKYRTIEDFTHDMRLIFTNCYQYNGEDTVYSRSAKQLEKYFGELLNIYKIGRQRPFI